MPSLHPRTRVSQESVFSHMSRLAAMHGAVNLGQGFPSNPPPEFLIQAAQRSVGHVDQYTPPAGLPALREALALEYGVSPEAVVVTAGATEALHVLAQALYGPGDQVLMLEPYFDVYVPQAILAGAEPVLVPMALQPTGWGIDLEKVAAAVNNSTRALLLNSPHNPTGYIMQPHELQTLAHLARQHDLWIISDEVYSELYYQQPPVSIWDYAPERTFRVGSAGKRLEATGWRVGWIVCPHGLAPKIAGIRQWASFCSASPLQAALATALPQARSQGYYEGLRLSYQQRRNLLLAGLERMGLQTFAPEGSYFLTAVLPQGDVELLTREAKVTLIPGSAFYVSSPPPQGLVRFAFCKPQADIELALDRLRAYLIG